MRVQVQQVLDDEGVVPFPDPFVEGFGWNADGMLSFPGMPTPVTLPLELDPIRLSLL